MGERDDGRIIGVGQDGQEYYLPKQSIDVRPIDWKARVIAAGSLLIAGGALAATLFHRDDGQKPIDNTSPGLVSTVEAMQTQQAKNLIGDCINENIIRSAMGVDHTNLKGCKDERDEWAKRFSATPSPTDTPKPVPSKGS